MIVVELAGGLGNQMFEYAAAYSLAKSKNSPLKMDMNFLLDRTPRENFVFRNFDLDIFGLEQNKATFEEIEQSKNNCFFKEPHFHFSENFLSLPSNAYLQGFWQSEKYFKNYENEIRALYQLDFNLDKNTEELYKSIKSKNSVCLNVRRGDFVSIKQANDFHGSMGLEYFNNAQNYLNNKFKNLHYFIFSDDIEWCKKQFKSSNSTVVEHKYAGDKFKTYLQLMSNCNHFIIPNSTFAWWAAWLNQSPEKIVIAPKKWFNRADINTDDLIPENWVRL